MVNPMDRAWPRLGQGSVFQNHSKMDDFKRFPRLAGLPGLKILGPEKYFLHKINFWK